MADQDYTKGIDAITSPTPTGPVAVPKLVRGVDGQMHTTYVDATTGITLSSLNGYTILENNQYYQPDISTNDKNKDGTVTPDEVSPDAQAPEEIRGGRSGAMDAGPSNPGSVGGHNTASNNFGYAHKPGIVGLASALPGIAGLAGKAVNAGWNAVNQNATNQARAMVGLPETSTLGNIKGIISNNKGQVSKNAKINGQDYSIGFEAMDPTGKRTNLTPDEARSRALTLGGIQEVAGPKTEAEHGLVRRAIDHIFSSEPAPDESPAKTTPTETQSSPSTPQSSPSVSRSHVSPVDASGVGFTESFGPNRPNTPKDAITGAVRAEVGKTFGKGYSVTGISGQEDEGKQYGSTRHKTGLAMDFDVTDSSGKKVTDTSKLNDLASNFAYDNPNAGIGFGTGYMAPGRMHLDVTGQAGAWGMDNTRTNMDPALGETIDAARAGYRPTPFANAPTPSARPDPSTLQAFTSQDERAVDKPVAQAVASAALSTPGVASRPDVNKMDLSNATPAQFASLGITSRTPEEKSKIAETIAGELSPNSLAGLKANDPEARTEAANMIASIENRAQSKMFDSLDKALSPTQYNSLMTANLGVTKANLAQYADTLGQTVDDYYSGALTPSNPKATNYYNPTISNPAWGPMMQDPTAVGEHVFGSLPEYDPDTAFGKEKSFYSAQDNYSGGGTSIGYGSQDTPSETSGIGRGMSGGSAFSGLGSTRSSDGNGYGTGPGTGSSFGGAAGQSGGAGYNPGGMNSPSGSSRSGGESGGVGAGASGSGSFGGSSSRGGLGISGSGFGGVGTGNSGTSSGSRGSNSGTSTGKGAGTNGSGSSKGSQSRSDGWS